MVLVVIPMVLAMIKVLQVIVVVPGKVKALLVMKKAFVKSQPLSAHAVLTTAAQSKPRTHVTELGKALIPPVLTITFVLSEAHVATRAAVR